MPTQFSTARFVPRYSWMSTRTWQVVDPRWKGRGGDPGGGAALVSVRSRRPAERLVYLCEAKWSEVLWCNSTKNPLEKEGDLEQTTLPTSLPASLSWHLVILC